MLSYDRARKLLVLRQFHTEGFVNQYVVNPQAGAGNKLLFESEAFENLPADWRAREIYESTSADEFTETFKSPSPASRSRHIAGVVSGGAERSEIGACVLLALSKA